MTNVKVVILIGAADFGRCPIASSLNCALWPVFGKPAVQRTVDLLADQGIRRFAICCRDDQPLINLPHNAEMIFLSDRFPRGPAGCIRDAADFLRDDLFVVLSGSMVNCPGVQGLCDVHRETGAPLTVFLNPRDDMSECRMESGIYVCSPEAVRTIPECGYMDLKEGLIRELVQSGKPAQAQYLQADSGNFRTWAEYIGAVGRHLVRHAEEQSGIDGYAFERESLSWIGPEAEISPKAVIRGPAVIGKGAVIEDEALLIGPSVVGENVRIGRRSIIRESILWDDATVAAGSSVQWSLVDYGTRVRSGNPICCEAVSRGRSLRMRRPGPSEPKARPALHKPWIHLASGGTVVSLHQAKGTALALFAVLLGILMFSYRTTLEGLWSVWLRSDEYSSGLLVPAAACYILWRRRARFLQEAPAGPSMWGFFGLATAEALRFFGFYYRYDSIERFSFVLAAGALVLLTGGRTLFRRVLPVFLFLFLMLPLPKQTEMQITIPLQRWATTSAVFCLETLGFNVQHEGNVIHIDHTTVAVAEACNGLRMLTAFLVVSGMVVLLIDRTRLEKGLILVSSVPIALVCNTMRLTVTAIFFTFLDTAKWERLFHDFGGFAMMPLALAIISLELRLFSALISDRRTPAAAVSS